MYLMVAIIKQLLNDLVTKILFCDIYFVTE